MDSGAYKHSLFGECLGTFRVLILAGDRQIFAPISSQGSAQSASVEEILGAGVFLDTNEIVLEIRISVREAVSEENLVVGLLPNMVESEGVEASRVLKGIPSIRILVVVYVLTYSMPTNTLIVLDLVRVIQHFHTVVIERVGLREINDIESYFLACLSV